MSGLSLAVGHTLHTPPLIQFSLQPVRQKPFLMRKLRHKGLKTCKKQHKKQRQSRIYQGTPSHLSEEVRMSS